MTEIATSTLHPLLQGRNIVKIATININGITAQLRISMLTEFIRLHELDILLVQEVTHPETLNVRGYTTHLNIGASMRGTAILARNEITLTNIINVPSGRAMAATYNGLLIINVYAPSGTARRTDRESFYTSELTCLLQAASHNVILGGDFNCVLQPVDTTGPFLTSRALMEIVRGLALADTWTQDPLRPRYTHYSPNGATRIDRIYTSHTLLERKTGTEIIPTAFTDHHAVVLRLRINDSDVRRGPNRWKMKPLLMRDENIIYKIHVQWAIWQNHKRFYPDITMWWERYVKNNSRGSSIKKKENVLQTSELWKITCMNVQTKL